MRSSAPWRILPNDLAPSLRDAAPWHAVYEQTHCWLKAGVFEDIVHDLREVLRIAQGRNAQPSGSTLDIRALQSSPESCARPG